MIDEKIIQRAYSKFWRIHKRTHVVAVDIEEILKSDQTGDFLWIIVFRFTISYKVHNRERRIRLWYNQRGKFIGNDPAQNA